MIHYFLLLNKQKNLSLKRKSDYKRNLIITMMFIVVSILFVIPSFAVFPKEDIKTFSDFLLPAIIILDFSLRFFLKKNACAAIIPYLTLPILRKTLIWYVIVSDLISFWIWGCGLIYGIILAYCGILTFWNAILLLMFILVNNYLIAFVKTLMGGYTLLIYPVCLLFVFILLLFVNLINPVLKFMYLVLILHFFIRVLFLALKRNLYKELNNIAL